MIIELDRDRGAQLVGEQAVGAVVVAEVRIDDDVDRASDAPGAAAARRKKNAARLGPHLERLLRDIGAEPALDGYPHHDSHFRLVDASAAKGAADEQGNGKSATPEGTKIRPKHGAQHSGSPGGYGGQTLAAA